jgi:hypothetical protein
VLPADPGRRSRRPVGDLLRAIAIAACGAALPLGFILGKVGDETRFVLSPPLLRAFVASVGVGAVVALAFPAARRLAGLAAVHLVLLGIVALAGGTFVADAAGTMTSHWLAAHAWCIASFQALLGTAAIAAAGVWRQEHALRHHRIDASARRLPAIADGQRLLGILLRGTWVALALALATIVAAAHAQEMPTSLTARPTIAAIAIFVAISLVLLLDIARGTSARERARVALLAYGVFLLTRLEV